LEFTRHDHGHYVPYLCLGIPSIKAKPMSMYLYIILGMTATFLLCLATILFYIKYRKNILKKQYELKTAEVQYQKNLLKATINSQESERKRIGMDLHDEVGANLSYLRLLIENFVEKNEGSSSLNQFNEQCRAIIDNIITNTRNISHNLSPLLNKSYGFQDMIYDYCDGINNSGKITVQVTFDQDKTVNFSDTVTLAMYRVITELINNTIKHARAKRITLCFSFGDGFCTMDYHDDGTGMAPGHKKGMGLQNIESRLGMIGASYHIADNIAGFNLSVTLPV
ncbi:sensor histidine kinase, partial [Pedobacter sp.]|uniref:sensor histidine kinase n=1 Tax=Pedobacter sp. TaxID=1411316 RepID=UPI002CD846A3